MTVETSLPGAPDADEISVEMDMSGHMELRQDRDLISMTLEQFQALADFVAQATGRPVQASPPSPDPQSR